MCIDYRWLNSNTKIDQFPLPWIDDIMDSLAGAKVFQTIDLRNAYHQVQIEPGREFKMAFQSKWGHYKYLVMPFGLMNAPTTFQRLINHVFRGYLD